MASRRHFKGERPTRRAGEFDRPMGIRMRRRVKALFDDPNGPAVLAGEIQKMPEPFTMADLMRALHRAFKAVGIPRNQVVG